VHLKAEPLEFAPVQYGVIFPDRYRSKLSSDDGDVRSAVAASSDTSNSATTSSESSSNSSELQPGVAYLKLFSSSATAPQQVAEALIDMQQLKTEQQLQQEQQPLQPAPQLQGLVLGPADNVGGAVWMPALTSPRTFWRRVRCCVLRWTAVGRRSRWYCPRHTPSHTCLW